LIQRIAFDGDINDRYVEIEYDHLIDMVLRIDGYICFILIFAHIITKYFNEKVYKYELIEECLGSKVKDRCNGFFDWIYIEKFLKNDEKILL
jgi:hypothetical protein